MGFAGSCSVKSMPDRYTSVAAELVARYREVL